MDRIGVLIQKLNDQHKQNAPLNQVLTTVMMLQKEITGSLKETEVLGNSTVSVLIPNAVSALKRPSITTVNDEKEYFELRLSDEDLAADEEPEESFYDTTGLNGFSSPVTAGNTGTHTYIEEIPTLSRQVRDTAVPLFRKSQEKKTNGSSPKIRELKKDIRPEERQKFINELFRGDENMYERSIKTIDNFNVHSEAEYWIKRELKTKLGWLYNDITVLQFEELVKRRFT